MYKFTINYKITPLYFPLRGKIDQLSKNKRALCWSIFLLVFSLDIPDA